MTSETSAPLGRQERPSRLKRMRLCPGSTNAEAAYPWTDSPAAYRGRRLHEAMGLLVGTNGSIEAWAMAEQICKGLDNPAQDLQALRDVFGQVQALMPDDPKLEIYIERPVDLSFLGMGQHKPDLFLHAPSFKAGVLVDYKFGVLPVDDPETNDQTTAYGIGEVIEFKLEAVEVAILQPLAYREDDRVRSHTFEADELTPGRAEGIMDVIEAGKDPKAPRIASEEACLWCAHKESCAERAAMLVAKGERREEAKALEIEREVLTGGKAINLVLPAELGGAKLTVITSEVVAACEALQREAEALQVTDQASADKAGELSKVIREKKGLIEKRRVILKKPILQSGKDLDALADAGTGPLEAGALSLDNKVRTWLRLKEAERKAAEEVERKRLADIAAAEAKARREAEAAAAAAAKALADAEALKGKAKAKALAEAQALTQASQAAAATVAEIIQAPAPAPIAAPVAYVPKGFRGKEVTTATVADISKIPEQWRAAILQVNQKALDALVASGSLTNENAKGWLVITKEQSTARA